MSNFDSLYRGQKIVLPDYVEYRLENGIPQLDFDRLWERYKKIKPIITFDGEKYLLNNLTPEDLHSLSFLSLSSSKVIGKCRKVSLSTLKEMRDFICLHQYGFSLKFRPSVNEVLSQIPMDLIGEGVSAFEIIERPCLPYDLHTYTHKPYHLSRVMTYKIGK